MPRAKKSAKMKSEPKVDPRRLYTLGEGTDGFETLRSLTDNYGSDPGDVVTEWQPVRTGVVTVQLDIDK